MAAKRTKPVKASPAAANHALALRDDRDDAARLVLADDLQQRGDPLGELIVIQCELARLPSAASQRRIDLQLRAEALVDRNRKRWVAHLPLTDREQTTVTFARGFPSSVTLAVERFLRVGQELFDRSSFDSLVLTQLGSLARVESAMLGRVVNLRLQSVGGQAIAGNQMTAALADDEACAELRSLDLSGVPLFDEVLDVIAAAPAARELTTLNIAATSVYEDHVLRFCKSGGLPKLTSLDLSAVRLTAASADAIANAVWPLTSLTLGFASGPSADYWGTGKMESAGLAALASSNKLTKLESFVFENQQADDVGIDALAKVVFDGLGHLSLAGNLFTSSGIRTLVESAVVSRLTSLDLSLNAIVLAVESLARATLPNLVTLKLASTSLEDTHVARLCAAPWMAQLVEIDLSNNALTDVSIDALAQSIPNAVSLNLRGNDLSAKALKQLNAHEKLLMLET